MNNETKWETSHDAVPDHLTQITVYEEATGERVATVFQAEAANLIAAAPELLKACEDLVGITNQLISEVSEAKGYPDDEPERDCSIFYNALTAISKAKGES